MSVYFKIHPNDEDAKQFLNNSEKSPRTGSCFSGYESFYQGDDTNGNVYFGFFAHPNVVKLVEEINNNFKNIHIVIIGTKEFKLPSNEAYYFGGEFKFNLSSSYNYCLFTVELDDKYIQESKYILSFILAQFIRGCCPNYKHFKDMENVENLVFLASYIQ